MFRIFIVTLVASLMVPYGSAGGCGSSLIDDGSIDDDLFDDSGTAAAEMEGIEIPNASSPVILKLNQQVREKYHEKIPLLEDLRVNENADGTDGTIVTAISKRGGEISTPDYWYELQAMFDQDDVYVTQLTVKRIDMKREGVGPWLGLLYDYLEMSDAIAFKHSLLSVYVNEPDSSFDIVYKDIQTALLKQHLHDYYRIHPINPMDVVEVTRSEFLTAYGMSPESRPDNPRFHRSALFSDLLRPMDSDTSEKPFHEGLVTRFFIDKLSRITGEKYIVDRVKITPVSNQGNIAFDMTMTISRSG